MAADARSRASRRPAEPWEEQENDSSPHVASPEAIALSHLRLMEALGSLPPRRRAVILLKEWEGCSLAEIARVMGWSEVRVKNELY